MIEDLWLEMLEREDRLEPFFDLLARHPGEEGKHPELLELLTESLVAKGRPKEAFVAARRWLESGGGKKAAQAMREILPRLFPDGGGQKARLLGMDLLAAGVGEKPIAEALREVDRIFPLLGETLYHPEHGFGCLYDVDPVGATFSYRHLSGDANLPMDELDALQTLPSSGTAARLFLRAEGNRLMEEGETLIETLVREVPHLKEAHLRALLIHAFGKEAQKWWQKTKKRLSDDGLLSSSRGRLVFHDFETLSVGMELKFARMKYAEKQRFLRQCRAKDPSLYERLIENLRAQATAQHLQAKAEALALLYEAGLLDDQQLDLWLSDMPPKILFPELPKTATITEHLCRRVVAEAIRKERVVQEAIALPAGPIFHLFCDELASAGYTWNTEALLSLKSDPAKLLALLPRTPQALILEPDLFKLLVALSARHEDLAEELHRRLSAIDDDRLLDLFHACDPKKRSELRDVLHRSFPDQISLRYRLKSLLYQVHPRFWADEEEIFLATPAAIEAKGRELDRLARVEIPKNAEEIALARSYGDLRENAEYKAAKQQQSLLHTRLQILKLELARVVPLRTGGAPQAAIPGCRVRLRFEDTEEREVVLLGPWEQDAEKGVLSYKSEIGRELLGAQVGEAVTFEGKEARVVAVSFLE